MSHFNLSSSSPATSTATDDPHSSSNPSPPLKRRKLSTSVQLLTNSPTAIPSTSTSSTILLPHLPHHILSLIFSFLQHTDGASAANSPSHDSITSTSLVMMHQIAPLLQYRLISKSFNDLIWNSPWMSYVFDSNAMPDQDHSSVLLNTLFLLERIPYTEIYLSWKSMSHSIDVLYNLMENGKLAHSLQVLSFSPPPPGHTFASSTVTDESSPVNLSDYDRDSESVPIVSNVFVYRMLTRLHNLNTLNLLDLPLKHLCGNSSLQWNILTQKDSTNLKQIRHLLLNVDTENCHLLLQSIFEALNPALVSSLTLQGGPFFFSAYVPRFSFLNSFDFSSGLSELYSKELNVGILEIILKRAKNLHRLRFSTKQKVTPSVLVQLCKLKHLKHLQLYGKMDPSDVVDPVHHRLNPQFSLRELDAREFFWCRSQFSPLHLVSGEHLKKLFLQGGRHPENMIPRGTFVEELSLRAVDPSEKSAAFFKRIVVSNFSSLRVLHLSVGHSVYFQKMLSSIMQAAGVCTQLTHLKLRVGSLHGGVFSVSLLKPQCLMRHLCSLEICGNGISWSQYVDFMFLTPKLMHVSVSEVVFPRNLLQNARVHGFRGRLYLLLLVVMAHVQGRTTESGGDGGSGSSGHQRLKDVVDREEWDYGLACFTTRFIEPMRNLYNRIDVSGEYRDYRAMIEKEVGEPLCRLLRFFIQAVDGGI